MTARDDYLYWPAPDERKFSAEGAWHWSRAMDEIDHLRAEVAQASRVIKDRDEWNDHLCTENSRLLLELAVAHGSLDLHVFAVQTGSNMCVCGMPKNDPTHINAEIQQVAGRVANGAALCGAKWRDTEARGWLWYCSLPVGHAGHHTCIGASW